MRRTQKNYVVAHVDMSGLPEQGQDQPPSAPQSSDDALGEVQDILAERTSTTLGCSEVLVVWKPSWIPITNVQDGPILRKFRAATKCYFLSATGKLLCIVFIEQPEQYVEKGIRQMMMITMMKSHQN